MLMPWGGGPTVTPAGIIPWWDEKGTGGGGNRFDEYVLCHTVDEYYVRFCLVPSTYVAQVNTYGVVLVVIESITAHVSSLSRSGSRHLAD